jgi:hypothetical protein
MKWILTLSLAAVGIVLSTPASAAVTYLNCPTLKPLPITSFMPAAMQPIKNAQTAYDAGNKAIKEAVTFAAQHQAQALSSAFNSIMTNMIQVRQTQTSQKNEIDRQYSRLSMAYEKTLNAQIERAKNLPFPTDASMSPLPGQPQVVDPNSPTYQFVKQMCTTAKMTQMMMGKAVVDKAKDKQKRRGQKILESIQAVNSVELASKRTVDFHFDVFCSEGDVDDGLCDVASAAPNADLDAFNFLYPRGFVDQNKAAGATYETIYTYSPVESLGAYQYVRNLTGNMYIQPPTESERSDARYAQFVTLYQQALSALNMTSDAMLSIAKDRDPVNNSGVVMSTLDILNYQVKEAQMPKNVAMARTLSENGKMIELAKHMNSVNQLRLKLRQQKDIMLRMKAAEIALDSSVNILHN